MKPTLLLRCDAPHEGRSALIECALDQANVSYVETLENDGIRTYVARFADMRSLAHWIDQHHTLFAAPEPTHD